MIQAISDQYLDTSCFELVNPLTLAINCLDLPTAKAFVTSYFDAMYLPPLICPLTGRIEVCKTPIGINLALRHVAKLYTEYTNGGQQFRNHIGFGHFRTNNFVTALVDYVRSREAEINVEIDETLTGSEAEEAAANDIKPLIPELPYEIQMIIVDKLVKSPCTANRIWVAEWDGTPQGLVKQLREDNDIKVRTAAAYAGIN